MAIQDGGSSHELKLCGRWEWAGGLGVRFVEVVEELGVLSD